MDDIVRSQQQVNHGACTPVGVPVRPHHTDFSANRAGILDNSRKEYALSNEIGDKAGGRAMVELIRSVPLLESAVAHHTNDVGYRKCFLLIVRHQQCSRVETLEHGTHLGAQALT